MGKFHETLGINELKNKNNIWKALLAEFLANVLLNFFGCASCVSVSGKPQGFVLISLTFGLVIFILVQTIGHVSGGHINPAVTAGMMSTGNISVIKGILYIIVQCLGALAGSALLKGLTPEELHKAGLGNTQLGLGFSPVQGFGVEFFLGFILILVICGVCDPNRPEAKPAAALAIGMAVAVGHLATVDFTGSSMNPARSFGSALIANNWTDHWVYWVGPVLGGIASALIYKHAFAAPNIGPLKIIERYTTVVTDEKEVFTAVINGICFFWVLPEEIFVQNEHYGSEEARSMTSETSTSTLRRHTRQDPEETNSIYIRTVHQ